MTSLDYEELQVKLMPLLMSGFTILLSLIALVQDVRSGSKASMPTDEDGDVIEDAEKKGTPIGDYFKAFGWFAALIVCVYFVGFLVATPLWMFAYLWKNGTQWWKAALYGSWPYSHHLHGIHRGAADSALPGCGRRVAHGSMGL